MKLTQLFSGETHVENRHLEDSGHIRQTPAQAENISRQLRSLTPGQTISGEVISKNGSEVQIRVSEDMILNARVDRSLNLELGKNMTFEVKNNGSTLTLSPLFTNVSTDVNVLKALDMAGLPVNRDSVNMTEQLMAAGMPVNRNSLQQIYRELNHFPQAAVSDIISLHKLQMPVNEANVNQMVSYRNLTHQLTEGMDSVLGALPEVFDSMVKDGDVSGAVKLYEEVLSLIREGDGEDMPVLEEEKTDAAMGQGGQAGALQENTAQTLGQDAARVLAAKTQEILLEEFPESGTVLQEKAAANAGRLEADLPNAVSEESGQQADSIGNQTAQEMAGAAKYGEVNGDTIPDTLRRAVADELLQLIDQGQMTTLEGTDIRRQVLQFAQGQADAQQLFAAFDLLREAGKTSSRALHEMEKLFSGKNFRELMAGQLKKSWTVSPGEIATPGKVEDLYRRLDRQLKNLTQALENAGQNNSAAFKAASSMSQNIDFLQQVNQMYAYVQLPLRLQQREAHGELYVYSNKKKLTGKDGKISALLHLDMEHLGPVDVYVAMQNSKVSTRFYLRDDDMIDFMSEHMELLTGRLQKRGYDCSVAMTVREDAKEATQGGLEPILGQEKGISLAQYAFDVRT